MPLPAIPRSCASIRKFFTAHTWPRAKPRRAEGSHAKLITRSKSPLRTTRWRCTPARFFHINGKPRIASRLALMINPACPRSMNDTQMMIFIAKCSGRNSQNHGFGMFFT